MNTRPSPLPEMAHMPRRSVLGLMLGGALHVAGCGGGTSVAGISSGGTGSFTGGTGSFTAGTIVGIGSIIVNGVRYDDRTAQVGDIDDDSTPSHWTADRLQLGMVVAVQGSNVVPTTAIGVDYTHEGIADRIVVIPELLGPVSGVSVQRDGSGVVTAVVFRVLGQAVTWQLDTLVAIDDVRSEAAVEDTIQDGVLVEVHGLWDSAVASWQATRINVLTTSPSFYRLSGSLSDIATDRQAFSISGQRVRSSVGPLDSAWGDGQRVRAVLSPQPQTGVWSASQVRAADWSAVPLLAWRAAELDGREAELEGIVPNYSGTRFVFEGVQVDVSALLQRPQAGQRVELKGIFSGEVLMVSDVENDEEPDRELKGYEVHGTITSAPTAVSAGVMSLSLTDTKGQTYRVRYDAQTEVEGVLSQGAWAKAKLVLQRDGSWYASKLEQEDPDDD